MHRRHTMTAAHIILILSLIQFSTSIVFENRPQTKRDSDASICDKEFTENLIVLRSPKYPYTYPPDLNCTYRLKGSNCQSSFKFEFLDFDLEDSLGCTKDRLEIDQLDALCGSRNVTKTYVAKNGSLEVKLKTDKDGTGRGFKILVTRTSCEMKKINLEEAETKNIIVTETPAVTKVTKLTVPNFLSLNTTHIRHCCQNIYDDKNFIITSPGFPFTLQQKEECVYKIQKSNSNICTLRFNLVFFWLGPSHSDKCPYGFLKIDGQQFCGCNQQLQFSTSFDQSYTKYLYFKSEGLYLNSQSGFVVEITQEECPEEYYQKNLLDISRKHKLYEDQINAIAWPYENSDIEIQQLNLLKEVVNKENLITETVYVFAEPTENIVTKPANAQDSIAEVRSNLLVSNLDVQCIFWNQIQLNVLQSAYGINLTCSQNQDQESSDKCIEIDHINGYFRSPEYPFWYPENQNLCYRFRIQPGYCAIKLFFDDFYLEDSYQCKKDFFLLGDHYRYCGHSLHQKTLTFDLRNKFFEDVRFVSDSFYTCRGFSGVYHQIACQDPDYPVNPIDPITPKRICDEVFIHDETFLIGVVRDYQSCSFRIRKLSKNVCKIELNFEKFYLNCSVEYLSVDGLAFCGNKTGRTVSIAFGNREDIYLIFKSTLTNEYDDLKFKITGQQIIDNCYVPDPAPERISARPSASLAKHHMGDSRPGEKSSYLIKMFDKHNFKDLCAIITSSSNNILREYFCDILSEHFNSSLCIPVDSKKEKDMPSNTQILEMNVNKAESVEKIEFDEIDCDDLI